MVYTPIEESKDLMQLIYKCPFTLKEEIMNSPLSFFGYLNQISDDLKQISSRDMNPITTETPTKLTAN